MPFPPVVSSQWDVTRCESALRRENQIKPVPFFLFHMNQIIAQSLPSSSFIGDIKVKGASDQSEEMKQQQAALFSWEESLFFLESESTLGRRRTFWPVTVSQRSATYSVTFTALKPGYWPLTPHYKLHCYLHPEHNCGSHILLILRELGRPLCADHFYFPREKRNSEENSNGFITERFVRRFPPQLLFISLFNRKECIKGTV